MSRKGFNWAPAIFLITYPILLVIALPLYLIYVGLPLGLIITTGILVIITNLAITMGYHRLYSHRSYKINKYLEPLIIFFGTLAGQADVIGWSHDHRLHHRFVDTDKDPYSIKKGFWHAHFLWLMKKRININYSVVKDLTKNKLLMFQHKNYVKLMILTNGLVILLFGWIFQDMLGSLIFVFLLRSFISHHSTFLINSAAHMFGTKPYSQEHTAVNNWLLSIPTLGEGYHNYHHTFSFDYRNGVKWYHFDPPKMLIWSLSKVGLATDLKRVDKIIARRKWIIEESKRIMKNIKGSAAFHKVQDISEDLSRRYISLIKMKKQYKILKKSKAPKIEQKAFKLRLKLQKRRIKLDFKTWKQIHKNYAYI